MYFGVLNKILQFIIADGVSIYLKMVKKVLGKFITWIGVRHVLGNEYGL